MRFAGPQTQVKAFRFNVDVVGETVFFVRKENSPKELIKDLKGHGHTFPEAYTTWDSDVRGSCSHQRIVQYDFGGLRFLVRTETDAYVKGVEEKELRNMLAPTDGESLDGALAGMAMSSSTSTSQEQEKLQMEKRGRLIPQSQIFDIKTRAHFKSFDLNEILPRLWMNQTSKFLIAYHTYGLFDKPEVKNVHEEVLGWESDNASWLERYHALVRRIVDVARDSERGQLEIMWGGTGPLQVTEQIGEATRALPGELLQLWE
jgi:hypothetical protein